MALHVRRQQNSDTIEPGLKVWFEGLGETVTPEGVTEKTRRKSPSSGIDGLLNRASIRPRRADEQPATQSPEPAACNR